MAVIVNYNDDEHKFGSFSFVGLLMVNNVQVAANPNEILFATVADLKRGESIWYDLTGSKTIGRFPDVGPSRNTYKRPFKAKRS